jgi:hypothetical protein
MNNPNHNHDRDSDHAANDNGEHEQPGGSKQVAPAPTGGALASIASLAAALANVPIGIGRTGLPMMLFKSREDGGTWGFGQRRTIPEEGSRWAVNPLTIQWGCISFGAGNKVVGERLVPITQPKPPIADMPDTTFPWQEEWSVNMKCLSGADAGVEVIFKATTDGTIKAIVLLVDELRNRLNGNQHNGKIVPIVLLEKDGYQHPKHGPTAIPVLTIVDWMSLDGPAPAPAPVEPTPPPVDQPRRRRVA